MGWSRDWVRRSTTATVRWASSAALCNHFQQVGFADVEGARAGDEVTAGVQDFQGAEIQLLVTAQRRFQVVFLPRESGRIDHHDVEALLFLVGSLEEIEAVGFLPFQVGESVQTLAALRLSQRVRRRIHAQNRIAMGRERQGKSARVGEAIQRAPASITCGGGAIFALVQKSPGLLPVQQVEAHLHAVFFHHNFADFLPRQHAALLRKALKAAHGDIIAFQDRARREFLLQNLNHRGLHAGPCPG